jgi:hypothetical protein
MNVIRKKGSKSKKSIQKNTSSTQEMIKAPAINVEEEKALDFGGLPDRDFKKNLGCG